MSSLTLQCDTNSALPPSAHDPAIAHNDSFDAPGEGSFSPAAIDAFGSAVHERLIDVRISAGQLRRQLGQGFLEEAEDTLEMLMRQLLRLDDEIAAGCF